MINHQIILDPLIFGPVLGKTGERQCLTVFGMFSIQSSVHGDETKFDVYLQPGKYSLRGCFGQESTRAGAEFLANIHYQKLAEPYIKLFKIERKP
jgi:hypothetical protein